MAYIWADFYKMNQLLKFNVSQIWLMQKQSFLKVGFIKSACTINIPIYCI